MGWRGLVAAALGLAFLQVAVSSGSGRLGGLLSGAGAVAQRFLSPAVPAFAKPAPKSAAPSSPGAPGVHVASYPTPSTVAAATAGLPHSTV